MDKNKKIKCRQCGNAIKGAISKNRICFLCEDYNKYYKPYEKAINSSAIRKMEQIFASAKEKKAKYDVMLLYSGGGDSTYLLYLLKFKYKLKVLALSVIHPLVNDLARQNITKITKKYRIDSKKITIKDGTYKEFIKTGLELIKKKKIKGPASACQICNYLRDAAAYNYALNKKIPVIVTGFNINQLVSVYPVIISDDIKSRCVNNRPFKLYKELKNYFNKRLRKIHKNSIFDFDLNRLFSQNTAEVIWPLSFLDLSLDKHKFLSKSQGLDNLLPSKTNCDALFFYDILCYRKIGVPGKYFEWLSQIRRLKYCHIFGSHKISKDQLALFVRELKKEIGLILKNKRTVDIKILKNRSPKLVKLLKNKESIDYVVKMLNKINYYKNYFR
ncbi:MAG TPA: hypothetical protein P5089_03805 [Candidatus Portnoybacteria bacterium]|nr:hypothetical protein [Candidatus Portnoybacteria bacterium]